jgi:hypothetical protein
MQSRVSRVFALGAMLLIGGAIRGQGEDRVVLDPETRNRQGRELRDAASNTVYLLEMKAKDLRAQLQKTEAELEEARMMSRDFSNRGRAGRLSIDR